MNKKAIFVVFLAAAALVFQAHAANAASVRVVEVATDTIVLQIDTAGASVNAVELHLTFDPHEFSVSSMRDGNSVVADWIIPPAASNVSGTVDLAGIVPGGIETDDGILVTIAIAPSSAGITRGFTFGSGQALLDDGKGTAAPLTFSGGPFAMSLVPPATSAGTGAVDVEPPAPFIPEVASNPDLFGGQYFLVFATTDEGSGMAYYEVLEAPTGNTGGTINGWRRATSPYLLVDQGLSSDIYVRAVDNAGNFRIVKLPAEHPKSASGGGSMELLFGILIGALLVGGISYFTITWRRKQHSK